MKNLKYVLAIVGVFVLISIDEAEAMSHGWKHKDKVTPTATVSEPPMALLFTLPLALAIYIRMRK